MLELRERYFDLMAQGMGTTEVCLLLGVSAASGERWRGVRGPAAVSPGPGPGVVSARYLSQDERIVIADRLRAGGTQAAIAVELGRSPATISREVRRNADPGVGGYSPYTAQRRAQSRRPRPRLSKLAASAPLREMVQQMLRCRHSPQQISRRLRRDFPVRNEWHVSHETIYQALYMQGRGQLRREVAAALRTGRAVRRPHREDLRRRGAKRRFAHPMVMISDRPAEADDRAVPGHWEGDLILGRNSGSAIGTLVERATRYVLLVDLSAGRRADQVRDGLVQTMATLPTHLKRSLTWDQGPEMALHHQFSLAADMPVYFCDPHSPWQRGSNENTNGLLRQYFPKGTDLSLHSPEDLAAVAAELNGRPRKTLGWDTPAERLAKLLTATE
jgi:IS30 family transposase